MSNHAIDERRAESGERGAGDVSEKVLTDPRDLEPIYCRIPASKGAPAGLASGKARCYRYMSRNLEAQAI